MNTAKAPRSTVKQLPLGAFLRFACHFFAFCVTSHTAACKMNGINYSTFMNGCKKAGIELNRKMLSEIAISDPAAFATLVETAKAAL